MQYVMFVFGPPKSIPRLQKHLVLSTSVKQAETFLGAIFLFSFI